MELTEQKRGEVIIITEPDGEEIRIDGTRVCRSSSPEKCWEERPHIINLLILDAFHKGQLIRREKKHEAA